MPKRSGKTATARIAGRKKRTPKKRTPKKRTPKKRTPKKRTPRTPKKRTTPKKPAKGPSRPRKPAADRAPKRRPFEFFLEALTEAVGPDEWLTKPMFGAYGVYVGGRIVTILRERGDADDGVWVCTTPEHHASLRAELPGLRSIRLFGPGETGWQNLPASGPDFEALALRLVRILRRRDPRVGKDPRPRKAKRAGSA